MIRAINDAERRARLGRRHCLARGAPSVVAAAGALIGYHATDPASVHLQAWARVQGMAIADLETALYEDRSLIRMLGMRRTMFTVPSPYGPVIQAACGRAIGAKERRRLIGYLTAAGIGGPDPERWLEVVEARTLEALAARARRSRPSCRPMCPSSTCG